MKHYSEGGSSPQSRRAARPCTAPCALAPRRAPSVARLPPATDARACSQCGSTHCKTKPEGGEGETPETQTADMTGRRRGFESGGTPCGEQFNDLLRSRAMPGGRPGHPPLAVGRGRGAGGRESPSHVCTACRMDEPHSDVRTIRAKVTRGFGDVRAERWEMWVKGLRKTRRQPVSVLKVAHLREALGQQRIRRALSTRCWISLVRARRG